jgi:hypothetical protein
MKNKEYHFDVNSVIGIKFVKEEPCEWFIWKEEIVKKRLFGKLKIYPAGFYDESSYREHIWTKEELLERGYKVYDWDERVNNRVCSKPYVVVYLGHKLEVNHTFESDEIASEWIKNLKLTSGKTFEII